MRAICETASRSRNITRDVVLVVLGSLLVAVAAKVQIPLQPVPLTCQDFAVLLVGATLGSRRGAAAMIVYLAQGVLGLPVFAGVAGPMSLVGPTAGYLLAFPIAAFVAGWTAERGWHRSFAGRAASLVVADALILCLGFAWCAGQLGVTAAWAAGVLPFLIWNPLKILVLTSALSLMRRPAVSTHA